MRFSQIHIYLLLSICLFAMTFHTGQAKAFQVNAVAQTTSAISWNSLSAEQKQALAPLSKEWNSMDAVHQKKWLGIASKYATMSTEEKSRVQERVNAWVNLTPKQRMDVRENFTKSSKLTQEKKSAQWQKYQQLSDEEKKQLATQAKNKKNITNILPESKRQDKTIEPLRKSSIKKDPVNSAPINQ